MNSKLCSLPLLLIMLLSSCNSRNPGVSGGRLVSDSDTGTAVIVFREYSHDFGKITEGEKVSYVFTFENMGSSDLIVAKVTTSCGCTAPRYDTKPISPGKTGNIEAVFNSSGMDGLQNKTITVKSNASVPVVLLRITAEVNQAINN